MVRIKDHRRQLCKAGSITVTVSYRCSSGGWSAKIGIHIFFTPVLHILKSSSHDDDDDVISSKIGPYLD